MTRKAFLLLIFGTILAVSSGQAQQKPYRLGVLMAGDHRNPPVSGLKEGLKKIGLIEGKDVVFDIKNAKGNRGQLSELAESIIQSKPHVAIAGGGVEADALKAASQDNRIPVVFLAVASAVDRQLVVSMKNPGGNLTGVDTNDTNLAVKRLWFIKKMMPGTKRVLIFSVPSITPSRKSAEIARENAGELGLQLKIIEVETEEEIKIAAASISRKDVDVILLVPASPVNRVLKKILYPISLAQKIPIMGYGAGQTKNGAMVSYAGSRYEAGAQAARLVHKVFQGIQPKDIPVETPQQLELVINRWMVDQLELKLPRRVWRLADKVNEIEVN